MKHYGLTLPEGTEITNLTAPIGTSFPGNANVGEMFYRTDEDILYVYDGNWRAMTKTIAVTSLLSPATLYHYIAITVTSLELPRSVFSPITPEVPNQRKAGSTDQC